MLAYLKQTVAAGALAAGAVVMVPSVAHAIPITQTFTLPSTVTEIGGTTGLGTFNYFQSAGAPLGAILNSVTLRISVTDVMDGLTVQNTAANPQTFSYTSTVNLSPIGTAPTADKNAINGKWAFNASFNPDLTLIDTGSLTYTAGETKTFAPPIVTESNDTGALAAANLSLYDTTGTFTLGFTTTTFQGFTGAGGNVNINQSTKASAIVEVVYDYTEPPPPPVPEPASMALLGSGLIGLGAFIRRRRAR